jgi:hypothetical protein
MPYDIFGYVEVAPQLPGPWRAAFSLDEIAGYPDDFSRTVFGLSKMSQQGSSLLGERGVPDSASVEVQDWMASSAKFEAEEGCSGDHGHTYATLAELKRMDIASDSPWHIVMKKIAELQQSSGRADSEIRVVVWANW